MGSHSRLVSSALEDCIFQCGSQFQPFSSPPVLSGRACSAGVASQQKVLCLTQPLSSRYVFCITLSSKLTPCHMSGSFYFSSFKMETKSFKDNCWGEMSIRVLVRTKSLWCSLELKWAMTSERTKFSRLLAPIINFSNHQIMFWYHQLILRI